MNRGCPSAPSCLVSHRSLPEIFHLRSLHFRSVAFLDSILLHPISSFTHKVTSSPTLTFASLTASWLQQMWSNPLRLPRQQCRITSPVPMLSLVTRTHSGATDGRQTTQRPESPGKKVCQSHLFTIALCPSPSYRGQRCTRHTRALHKLQIHLRLSSRRHIVHRSTASLAHISASSTILTAWCYVTPSLQLLDQPSRMRSLQLIRIHS